MEIEQYHQQAEKTIRIVYAPSQGKVNPMKDSFKMLPVSFVSLEIGILRAIRGADDCVKGDGHCFRLYQLQQLLVSTAGWDLVRNYSSSSFLLIPWYSKYNQDCPWRQSWWEVQAYLNYKPCLYGIPGTPYCIRLGNMLLRVLNNQTYTVAVGIHCNSNLILSNNWSDIKSGVIW